MSALTYTTFTTWYFYEQHSVCLTLDASYLRGGDKGVSGRVRVIPSSEVPVEGRHDRVLLSLFHVLPKGPTGHRALHLTPVTQWNVLLDLFVAAFVYQSICLL